MLSKMTRPKDGNIYLLFYVKFNSQGDIATGSLQVGETSVYCTVNHWASSSNYQLSNIKPLAPRFEPAASEVGGMNSNRYTTEPKDGNKRRVTLDFHTLIGLYLMTM